jgi:hypothetical protein
MIVISTEVRGVNKEWTIPEYSLQDYRFLEESLNPLSRYLQDSLDRNEYNEIVLWDADGHPMSQVRQALYKVLGVEDKKTLDLCIALDQHEEMRIQIRKRAREAEPTEEAEVIPSRRVSPRVRA